MEETRLMTLKVRKKKIFLRSDRQAERSLKRDYYQKKIRALMPNRTATITRIAEKVANIRFNEEENSTPREFF